MANDSKSLSLLDSATPAAGDLAYIVDVDDLSHGIGAGSPKKTTLGDIVALAGVGAEATARAAADAVLSSAISSEASARAAADATLQPLDSDLTAIAALSTTAFGRALLELANAVALRTAAALGTVSTLDSDTDGTLAANSDGKVATQKATKAYVDAHGGAISSVSNSDGTLTISPTTGSVVGSLNLAHANIWTEPQTIAGYNATGYSFRVGDFILQPFSTSNSFLSDNIYFNGSNFVRAVNGSGGLFQFYAGQTFFYCAPNDVAGSVATMSRVFKIDYTGLVAFGGGASSTPGDATGSYCWVDNSGLFTASKSLLAIAASNSTIGFTIQGVASQSATLMQLKGISSTAVVREMAEADAVWEVDTDASRTTYYSIRTITNAGLMTERLRADGGGGASPTAGNIGLMLWDVDSGTLVRVTRGAADSGGTGFRLLRVPN